MDSFLIALNAVVPFLIYISFGYLARSIGLVDELLLKQLNQMVFKAFFPLMMFCNLYGIDPGTAFDMRFIATAIISVLIVVLLSFLLVPKLIKENPRRGVVIQAIYRGNAVLFMVPLMVNIYGEGTNALTTMLLAFSVPLYNVLAVIILETYRGGKVKPTVLLKNVAKNPMICGAAAGLACYLLGVEFPDCVYKPLQQYANLCTPLGMFVLGGTLKFSRLHDDLKCVIGTLAVKMVIIPAIVFGVALLMGFGPVERFLLMALYATPVAASSYPMAQSMGGDGDLAGELVVLSTALSVVSLFLWIFTLGNLGLM